MPYRLQQRLPPETSNRQDEWESPVCEARSTADAANTVSDQNKSEQKTPRELSEPVQVRAEVVSGILLWSAGAQLNALASRNQQRSR